MYTSKYESRIIKVQSSIKYIPSDLRLIIISIEMSNLNLTILHISRRKLYLNKYKQIYEMWQKYLIKAYKY